MTTSLSDDQALCAVPPVVDTPVVLTVTQDGSVVEQFELPPGKCTIGSSPSCQLRLEASSVRPLQCLVVRQGNEITVTRWAPGITLNGLEFSTAPFVAEDLLAIGNIKLQLAVSLLPPVVESQCPVSLLEQVQAQVDQEVNQPIATNVVVPLPELLQQPVATNSEDLNRARAVLQQARQRLRRLIGTSRTLRNQTRNLEQNVAALNFQLEQAQAAQAQLAEGLHQAQAVAVERESQFAEELDRAIAELSASYERTTSAERALWETHTRFEQLENQVTSLTQECGQLQQTLTNESYGKASLENELAQREIRFKELEQQYSSVQFALESARLELQTQTSALYEQIAEINAEREQRVAVLEQELAGLQQASNLQFNSQNESFQNKLAQRTAEHEQRVAALEQDLANARNSTSTQLNQQQETFQAELAKVTSGYEQQSQELQNQLAQAQQAAREAIQKLEAPNPIVQELEAELGFVQNERQDIANENFRLKLQVGEAEKRVELLEIDVRSITAEWQRAQATATQLQESYLNAEAHVTDLKAKLDDLECATAVEWSGECDRVSALLTQAHQELAAREADLASATQQHNNLIEQLSQNQSELADAHRQLADLQANITRIEKDKARLDADLASQNSKYTELEQALSQRDSQSASELASRNTVIAEFENTLAQNNSRSASELAARNAIITELESQLEQIRGLNSTQLADGESRIAELTAQFANERAEAVEAVELRDSRITELSIELQKTQQQAIAELESQQSRINALKLELETERQQNSSQQYEEREAKLTEQISQAQDHFSATLKQRDDEIGRLEEELRQTQDQLVDCAAQGERLNELYQQVRQDLAAAQQSLQAQVKAVETEVEDSVAAATIANDPRDDEEPRLIRAIASVATQAERNDGGESVNGEEPSTSYQPTSFIDRYSHVFDEGDAPAPTMPTPSPARAVAEPQHELTDDSAALEAYMANMMRRVRGESSSEAITPPVELPTSPEPVAAYGNPVGRMNTLTKRVAAHETPAPASEGGLIDLHELKGTSQKPPLPTSLSAMRELANISARQAIAKHRKRRHFEHALSKLLVSTIAGGTAAYMLFTADDLLSPYFLSGCAIAVISGFWGFKLLGVLLEVIRDGINNEVTPAELSEMHAPLPIDGSAE